MRRQANVVVRLTVITTVGLIGTTVTGFLGMNLIAAAENPLPMKLLYFALVFVPTTLLLVYTVVQVEAPLGFLRDALRRTRARRAQALLTRGGLGTRQVIRPAALLGVACALPNAHGARPMVTDDARIVDPKACQVETWVRADRTQPSTGHSPRATRPATSRSRSAAREHPGRD